MIVASRSRFFFANGFNTASRCLKASRKITHLPRTRPASLMVWFVSWGVVRMVRQQCCLDVSSFCWPACNDYGFKFTCLWLHDHSELRLVHKWSQIKWFWHMQHWFGSATIGQCGLQIWICSPSMVDDKVGGNTSIFDCTLVGDIRAAGSWGCKVLKPERARLNMKVTISDGL